MSKLNAKSATKMEVKNMIYGYARVSTNKQELEVQLNQLKERGCDKIYSEKHTATISDRPELRKVLEVLEKGDTLMVTKLDRLARNTSEGISIIDELFRRGIRVYVLNIGLLENTVMGRFFLQTMLAVAEMERNMIIERTIEGKKIAKKNKGYKEGRPKKFSKEQIRHAMQLLEDHSVSQVSKMTGISQRTLFREKARLAAGKTHPRD